MSESLEYALAAAGEFSEAPAQPLPSQLDTLSHHLLAEFAQAENDRRQVELRWLRDLRQYRGQYDPEVLAAMHPKRSKAFVRKTRVKCVTLDSRIADLLFPVGAEKNWSVEPTPKPALSPEQKEEILQLLQQAAPDKARDRAALDQATKDWAEGRAKAMARTIDDQLTESRYKDACLQAIHSGNLFGTGILKGPLVERRVRTRFVKQGKKWVERSESYVAPWVDYVPLWRFYPDMTATSLEQCRYVYERHQMSKHQLADLAKRKSFNGERIKAYIQSRPRGDVKLKFVDNELRIIGERVSTQGNVGENYDVLERWGWLDGEKLREAGVKVPDERLHESFFSNVWLLPDGQVIKAVLQPINGVTWPYHIYSFDKDESSFFAEGLASIMRDDQDMLNAAVRMIFDNAAITAGPQFEANVDVLSPLERLDEVFPFKVWKRRAGATPTVQGLRVVEVPSHISELTAIAQMCDTNADEVTAIPRYMTGEASNQGAAGTASGMSMLMGAANIVVKSLINAWDEGITKPFITALYRWNMQFHGDDGIKGDFDVKALGSASLVAKEVRARALNEFAVSTANPLDAPFVKRDVMLRLRAESNELAGVVKTEDEVKQEMEGGAAKQAAEVQRITQELMAKDAMAKIQKLEAEAARAMAEVERIKAMTVETRVSAAYAAMQAGGVAVTTPHAAPAGDELLRSAGWTDATPATPVAGIDAQAAAAPAPDLQPQTGKVGERQGIETPQIDG